VVELCGVRSLSFAVGAYLPLSTTSPIWVGGLLKWWQDRRSGHADESELSSGMLYSTGLVAGGSLTGIAMALLGGIILTRPSGEIPVANVILDAVGIHGWERLGGWADVIGIAMFGVLCFILLRAAKQKLEV
jgi:hypothetical protein